MSHPALKELIRAEQLFDDGRLDEALELLKDKSNFEGVNFQQKSHFQFLKGLILYFQHKNLELVELGAHMFNEGRNLEDYIHSFDGLYFILMGLCLDNRFTDAVNKIGQADIILTQISNIPKNEIIRRELRLCILKSWIDMQTGKVDLAEKRLEELLRTEYDIENPWELFWANLFMASIQGIVHRATDISVKYNEKAISLAKIVRFNHYWLGYYHINIGRIHLIKCEYELSFKHHFRSLEYFQQVKNNWFIAKLYNNLGLLYNQKGDYDSALKCLEDAITLWEPYLYMKDACLDSLIWISLEKGDEQLAKKYFKRLEKLCTVSKVPSTEEIYKFNKALMLKRSSRIRDKAKAEELLKQVIESDTLYLESKIAALTQICDLLLAEFRINNNNEVLEELNIYISSLLAIAEANREYYIFCNTFLLQARLALLNFNIKGARRFLIQAQKIAESYGIKELAMRISHEHDELIKQSKLWENLKDTELSLEERWKLAGLSEQMEKMVKKRMDDFPEVKNEEPVLLLIVSEGGIPFFSHSFMEDKSFESHLFGGFLSTIDYFINEMFSEGLDRAIFGEHTLLMKPMSPFFISYIFKGDSYYALQKLDYFKDRLQKEDEIWKMLLNNFEKNTSIQLKNYPPFESLITETFISNKCLKSKN